MSRALATLAIVCAVAFLSVAAVWAYSFHRIAGWRASSDPHVNWTFNTGDGLLDVRRVARLPVSSDQGRWVYVAPDGTRGIWAPGLTVERTREMRWVLRPGETARGVPNPPSRMVFDSTVWHVRLFYWLPALLLAGPPAAWVDRRRRRRRLADRRAAGLCIGCGYDLRASPRRCPECGVEQGRPATDPAAACDVPSTPSSPG